MHLPERPNPSLFLALISVLVCGLGGAAATPATAEIPSAEGDGGPGKGPRRAVEGHTTRNATNDPFDLSLWEVSATDHRVASWRGREALWLDSGTALLRDDTFIDGVIELDIAVTDAQGFAGITFRDDGAGNAEHFYIRSHLSGMPDASQYTPVFNGVSGWQIYAGPRFNAAMEMVHDRWMHLKVVVSGRRAEIYLDSDEPLFVIPELIHEEGPGHIALTASGAPARFANVQVRHMDNPPAIDGGAAAEPVADTIVDRWSVSPPFEESLLQQRHDLSTEEIPTGWRRLAAGERGIANLARLAGIDGDANTVVAALRIDAEEERTIPAHFGFSDRVHVYLNGRLLFSAADGWRSRDYRFLGTIGLHDTVYLPLQVGRNDLWFAVSESFGGWGIVLDLPDREGLTVDAPR